MKAVIQRVLSASATLHEGDLLSSIGNGLCVLIGISKDDTPKDIEFMVRKILNLRFFDDNEGKRWSKSVKDKQYEILCLSQITLYHKLKGNKLDFHHAMSPEDSRQFYNNFLDALKSEYDPAFIKEGKFGAHIVVSLQNDGPVTVVLESKEPLKPVKSVETNEIVN